MRTYLLDTSVLIAFFSQQYRLAVSSLLERLRKPKHALATCGIILSEFYQGVERKDAELYSAYLDDLVYLPATRSIFENAGLSSHALRKKGVTIPLGDCLVAAWAKEYGATLLTFDQHFRKIPRLKVVFHSLS